MAEELVYNSIHTGVEIDEGISKTKQIVNPNLLDNWYFGNPVNQKGQTEYPSGARQYFVDRWVKVSNLSAVIEAGHIAVTNASSSGNAFSQYLRENLEQGEEVTLSCLTADGSLYYGTVSVPSIENYTTVFTTASGSGVRMQAKTSGGDAPRFIFMVKGETTERIVALKLERGSKQTLAHQDESGNWVLNEIPDYGEQLLKCQRYYQLFSSADARPSDLADYRPSMRATPAVGTIDIGGKTYYFADANL